MQLLTKMRVGCSSLEAALPAHLPPEAAVHVFYCVLRLL